jgi:hypothetical protein
MTRLTRSAARGTKLLALAAAATLAAPAFANSLTADVSAQRPRVIAKVGFLASDVNSDAAASATRQQPRAEKHPVYRPPLRGAPRAKVGGGMRGALAVPTLQVLTPAHVAETVSAQPSLFWHIDAIPGDGSTLMFTLLDEEGIDPVVEAALDAPARIGIQRIRLADHGVTLEPGIEYEWSVALVVDPARRAKDVISTGYIRRVPEPVGLRRRPAGVATYAELGLWYEALESISDRIDASAGDGRLRSQRAALLHQAGLDSAID